MLLNEESSLVGADHYLVGQITVMNLKYPFLLSVIDSQRFPRLLQAMDESNCYTIERGEYLFRKGDLPNKLAVTISGQVEVSYIDEQGNYVIIEKCSEDFWFGDATFVDGRALPYSSYVLSNVKVLSVLHTQLRREPDLENETY